MKKTLWISNIISIGLLIFVALHYQIPHKIYNKLFEEKVVKKKTTKTKPNCYYPLEYFDFHYVKETDSPKIIMLGNSIVRHGDWTDLLNRQDVINRGISGDNLACICQRLPYLKGKKAKIWFIEGGINDLPGKSPLSLFENYKSIVEFVKSENSIPVIDLVLYISPKAGITFPSRKDYEGINTSVTELNNLLIEYAEDNHIDYIDLNKIVSDKNDVLKDEYTIDGVHLTPSGYKEWSQLINEILIKYKI